MEPNEGETLEEYQRRFVASMSQSSGEPLTWERQDALESAAAHVYSAHYDTMRPGTMFTDSAGTVRTQVGSNLLSGGGVMTVVGQRVPISSWSINRELSAPLVTTPADLEIRHATGSMEGVWSPEADIPPGDTIEFLGHTYRRIDEVGKPVLPPACATLAGLLAFVLAHPNDGGAVAALADRLALSEDREREVPEVVGALVGRLDDYQGDMRRAADQLRGTAEAIAGLRQQITALEDENRSLLQGTRTFNAKWL